jgi:hypothetical protein
MAGSKKGYYIRHMYKYLIDNFNRLVKSIVTGIKKGLCILLL